MHMTKRILAIVLSLVMLCSLVIVGANASQKLDEEDGKWVSAWSTSMVDASIDDLFDALGATNVSNSSKQIALSALKHVAISLNDVTCRSTIQPTIEGEAIRLTLSNVFGATDVTINRMTAARSSQDAPNAIDTSTLRNVTVGGSPIITIPAGATVTTDLINIPVDERDSVSFSIYLKDKGSIRTVGLIGGDTYLQKGDATTTASLSSLFHLQYIGDFGEYSVIPFITDMQVLTDPDDEACAAVILGDSTMTNDIPIYLSEKLDKEGINVSLLQEAIKGNEVLGDGKGTIGNILGQSAIKRFDRDVLEHEGLKYLIIKIGCNDIIHSRCASKQSEYAGIGDAADGGISGNQVIAGYKQILDKVNEHNKNLPEDEKIEVYFVSRALWNGYTRNLFKKDGGDDIHWSPEVADQLITVNHWLYKAANGGADGYKINGLVDITSMEDTSNLGALRQGFSKDGVHLTEIGQKAFCNIFPVSIFKDGTTTVSDDDFIFSGLNIFDYNDFVSTKRTALDFYSTIDIGDDTPLGPGTTTTVPTTEPTTVPVSETTTVTSPTTDASTTTTETSVTETTTSSLVTPPTKPEETSANEEEESSDTTTTTKSSGDDSSIDLTGIGAKLSKFKSFFSKVTKFVSKLSDVFTKLFG